MQPRYGTQGVIRNGAVVVSGRDTSSKWARTGTSRPAYPNATVVGSSRYWVIPGFVNAHQHGKGLTDFQLGGLGRLFRDLAVRGRSPGPPWIPYLDVLYACKTMIESGITTCLHYNSSLSPKTHTRSRCR